MSMLTSEDAERCRGSGLSLVSLRTDKISARDLKDKAPHSMGEMNAGQISLRNISADMEAKYTWYSGWSDVGRASGNKFVRIVADQKHFLLAPTHNSPCALVDTVSLAMECMSMRIAAGIVLVDCSKPLKTSRQT
jgi:hypothetical protein